MLTERVEEEETETAGDTIAGVFEGGLALRRHASMLCLAERQDHILLILHFGFKTVQTKLVHHDL
jgi:hypothetical protein